MPEAKAWLLFALLVPVYTVTVFLGHQGYLTPDATAVLRAASGVLLAFLLLLPLVLWLPALVVTQLAGWAVSAMIGTSATVFADVATAGTALVGALLIRLALKTDLTVTSLRSLVVIIVAGAIVAPGLASLWGAQSQVALTPSVDFWTAWQVWWFADLLGVVVATPFLLVWINGVGPIRRWGESLACLIALLAILALVMGGRPGLYRSILDFPYLVTVPLIWLALRADTRLLVIANVILALGTVWLTAIGRGPFIYLLDEIPQANVLGLQAFLITMIIGTGLLHAAQAENRLANREKIRLLEAAFRAQKLEVLGRLAANVAHSFNNDLTVIRDSVERVRQAVEDPDAVLDGADEIDRAAERSTIKVHQLLAYGSNRTQATTQIDVDEHLESMLPALQTAAGSQIPVTLQPKGRRARINANLPDLEQSIFNLVLNARDAIDGAGTITIFTRRLWRDTNAEGANLLRNLVEIGVRDDGVGMTPEVIEHAYEPFFTTKQDGQGSGLGLASVYRFVRDAGGWLELNSMPNAGTTVILQFPPSA